MDDKPDADGATRGTETAVIERRRLLGLLGLGSVATAGLAGSARAQGVDPGRYLERGSDGELDFVGAAEWENRPAGNTASGPMSVVAGGNLNEATAEQATVSGGVWNRAEEGWASVGGGLSNAASGQTATIAGGAANRAEGRNGTVSGGKDNRAMGEESTVSGGERNRATGDGATVAGGHENRATDDRATVSGGGPFADRNTANRATARGSTVSGGLSNRAGDDSTTVGGGVFNRAISDGDPGSARAATVAGGANNRADSGFATVGGGSNGEATARFSTVAGGKENEARGRNATVPGGQKNRAAGLSSLAAGDRARADHDHTFVWNDADVADEEPQPFASTGEGQFLVHARGGVGVGTNEPRSPLHVAGASFEFGAIGSLEGHLVSFEEDNNHRNNLALKSGQAAGEMGPTTNFVTFLSLNETAVGAIEGNGGGGVRLKSGGADYAERLPLRDPDGTVEPGDVVGVHSGEIAAETSGADRAMVVSEAAVVLGNAGPESATAAEPVAFVGQVPTKVRGPAETGDLIVPSGAHDGTGVAVAPSAWRPGEHGPIVGRAWESDHSDDVRRLNVAVGLDESDATAASLDSRQDRLDALETENERLRDRLDDLEHRLARLESATAETDATAVD